MTPRKKLAAAATGSALVLLAAAGAHIAVNLAHLTATQGAAIGVGTGLVAAGLVYVAYTAHAAAGDTVAAILAEERDR